MDEDTLATWMAGLFSTDGCITRRGNSFSFRLIGTVERDWAERVKKTVEDNGFDASILSKNSPESFHDKVQYTVRLKNPHKVAEFFEDKHIRSFMCERKYKILQDAIEIYCSDEYTAETYQWTEEREKKLAEILVKEPDASDDDIAERLGVSQSAVGRKRRLANIPGAYKRPKMDDHELEQKVDSQ